MHDRLNHLSQEDIERLIARYYAGEPARNLILEYKIDVRSNDLYKTFPPEICEGHFCEYCNTTLIRERCAKSHLQWKKHVPDMFCPNCLHRPLDKHCECPNCLKLIQEKKDTQVRLIRDTYDIQHVPILYEDLSLKDKVYLGAICKTLLNEDMMELTPLETSTVSLAPTKDYSLEIIDQLAMKKIITVSPTSTINSFDLKAPNFPLSYYSDRVNYSLNLTTNTVQDLLSEILNPTYGSNVNEYEAVMLWREIAIHECIEYLLHQDRLIHIKFSPGVKTKAVFKTLLNYFSVSQIYHIIYSAVNYTSRLCMEKPLNKKHAANTVVSNIERYGEKAIAGCWDLSGYGRIKELPQSALSSFFFNRVLGIGEKGFTSVPSIENLLRQRN